VRQLKGASKAYEIGTTMDARLIGRMYDSGIGVYSALQNVMRMEDALYISQELERQGIGDDVSLILFSDQAKAHKGKKGIAQVAANLLKTTWSRKARYRADD
jgi:hypothetical protein